MALFFFVPDSAMVNVILAHAIDVVQTFVALLRHSGYMQFVLYSFSTCLHFVNELFLLIFFFVSNENDKLFMKNYIQFFFSFRILCSFALVLSDFL